MVEAIEITSHLQVTFPECQTCQAVLLVGHQATCQKLQHHTAAAVAQHPVQPSNTQGRHAGAKPWP